MLTMARLAGVLALGGMTAVVACGGETFESTSDAGVAGSGGSHTGGSGGSGGGSGGTSGAGGSGGTSGAGGSGGTSGAGGSGGCPPCAGMACPPGWVEKPTSDGCCYTCEPPDMSCEPAASCTLAIGCADGEYFNFAGDCCACRPWSCDGVTCPEVVCADGSVMLFPEGSCCGVCAEPTSACDPGSVECAQVTCPPDQAPVDLGNGCCGGCAPAAVNCDAAGADYQLWLAERITSVGATGCNADADCTVEPFSNACWFDCGTAIAKGYADLIALDAEAYGQAHCAGCPQGGAGCPAVVLTARCLGGTCTLN